MDPRGRKTSYGSRIWRRMVGFNLVSLGVMLGAMIVLSPTRDMLVQQRQEVLDLQARLIAAEVAEGDGLDAVPPGMGQTVALTAAEGRVLESLSGPSMPPEDAWIRLLTLLGPSDPWMTAEATLPDGNVIVLREALTVVSGVVGQDYGRLLVIFAAALLVSVGISLALASRITRPLRDLTDAAGQRSPVARGRIAIPDMTDRSDEIGRLSEALRGMVDALYDRIDANEQFAADVAHEIKNPLASLRSAVDTLRVARDDQRVRLLDIIDHDIRRLDRLVSDISNASRLDSELVKEEEEPVDLTAMLRGLTEYLGHQAGEKGVTLVADLPETPIVIQGLEARLAQVFVNLITNALSFSEGGTQIRVWAHRRADRALVVVEDQGPGIPEEALTKIFDRFYSERPMGEFGEHSGLGLSISRQIVEAHEGVIWAENIRSAMDGPVSGARFVVGLPA